MRCQAPAKLIISGEHSILYGAPAISVAVDLPSICQAHHRSADTTQFDITLSDLNAQQVFSLAQIQDQGQIIEQRLHAYQQGQLKVQAICPNPFDLVIATLYFGSKNLSMTSGQWQLSFQSKAWVGRGLGSSASLILTLLKAVFGTQLSDTQKLYQLARQIEHLQHGQSSGLDPATLIHGGMLYFQRGHIEHHSTPPHYKAWLIDTGRPQATTGECVEHVRRHHARDMSLWQQFSQCTQAVHQAWLDQDPTSLKQQLNHNQALLSHIGVVPPSVAQRLQHLNHDCKGAGKVCGAGSLSGEQAGVVLGLYDQDPSEHCKQWDWNCQPLTFSHQGLSCHPKGLS